MNHDFSNKKDKKRVTSVNYINTLINNKVTSQKIEQSIYNYVIKLSKERMIQRKWDNQVFNKLYTSKIISIYSNLNEIQAIPEVGNVTLFMDVDFNNASFTQSIVKKSDEIEIINEI